MTWKEVFDKYDSGEIDAEQASKLLQEIREKEWKDLNAKHTV